MTRTAVIKTGFALSLWLLLYDILTIVEQGIEESLEVVGYFLLPVSLIAVFLLLKSEKMRKPAFVILTLAVFNTFSKILVFVETFNPVILVPAIVIVVLTGLIVSVVVTDKLMKYLLKM